MTLKQKLEAWADKASADSPEFYAGLSIMLDQLWPVIEAAERASKNMDESYIAGYEFDGTKFEANTILNEALAALEAALEKLEGRDE